MHNNNDVNNNFVLVNNIILIVNNIACKIVGILNNIVGRIFSRCLFLEMQCFQYSTIFRALPALCQGRCCWTREFPSS